MRLGLKTRVNGWPKPSKTWHARFAEKCPNCESAYLIEKYLKSGAWAQCPNYKECKFKRELEPAVAATAVSAEAVPA